ncbi:MAG: ATP:ADP antiporter, AAA family [Candidatus Kentron sp. G]|nr:MAG: ATP:ADP antiporter, AAA family [Candidatus Kentron sp. G]VFM97981.1 MAG: ATP:ADP antiporter, AAA family [Candidatus Kentron sp. G]VFM98350.1 MAG: ATP:ADP antiporter, AAA family [Candidatus Kentron sp. G]
MRPTNTIKDSFTRESLTGAAFFFFVLASWYVLRPVRNEIAVENSADLPSIMAIGALVMLLINPVYSWLASRADLGRLLLLCYCFFLSNLGCFVALWGTMGPEGEIWLGRVFLIWCNVYSFFVASIFWVVIINIFRGVKSRVSYGVIMAGGSFGALVGSELSKRVSASYSSQGIAVFALITIVLLSIALLIGLMLISGSGRDGSGDRDGNGAGGTGFDAFKNALTDREVRSIAIYVYLWTGLMTVHWMSAIGIIDGWSADGGERIRFFSAIEQAVTLLTLPTQLFLTSMVIGWLGIKRILAAYGVLFFLVFALYGLFPTIGLVVVSTVFLRLFEYGINKPAREIVFSLLPRNDRYKSSVFIDTFVARLGGFSGSGFLLAGKSIGIAEAHLPFAALPLTILLSVFGLKISASTGRIPHLGKQRNVQEKGKT